jgi:squalene-hopene/tetraprenyl-beta-curcumene cyclase
MLDPDERADSSSAPDRSVSMHSRVHVGGAPLEAGLERARAGAAAWRERAAPDGGPTPWLLHVPDVGPTCEVLLADRLFHDLHPAERAGLVAFVRGAQDEESGAWLDAFGRPDLSLTTLGWWVLRDAGDDPRSDPMLRACRVVHRLGGAQRANFAVRLWLAMGGQIPWTWLPAIPSELFLLPAAVALSPARYSPWARGVLTPYFIIARAPARLQLPDASPLVLPHDGPHNDRQPVAPRLTRPGLAGDVLQAFDRTVKLARKLPRGPLPRMATRRALEWIDTHQQAHGGWFSVRPTLLSLVALRVMGATSHDPRLRRGLDHLRRSRGQARIPHGRAAGQAALAQGLGAPSLDVLGRLYACEATAAADAYESEVAWLLRQELAVRGPWQARADAATGGWPHEAGASHHLDVEATCAVLQALAAVPAGSTQITASWATARRAIDVLLAMQEADGRFSRFERGESDVLMQRLPWTDADLLAHGRPDDAEHLRVSAQALTALASAGFRADDDRVGRGVRWLEKTLAPKLHEHVSHGSLAVVARLAEALGALVPSGHAVRRELEQRLRTRQREDGSFGSTVDTAHALQGLVALGQTDVQAQRAARWLCAHVQRTPADELDAWSRPVARGVGLSPAGFDPSAGPREAALALAAYQAAGGR